MKAIGRFFGSLFNNRSGTIGFIIITLSITLTITAPLITNFDPESPVAGMSRMAPDSVHWFGTDDTGMDVFTRVIYSGRIALTIALSATFLSMLVGVPLGLIVAYFEGIGSEIVMRIMDLLQAFPVFIFAMVIVTVLGNNVENVIIAITFLNAPVYLRLVRSEALSYKSRPFIDAAKCTGNSPLKIIFTELLPVSIRPVFIQASVNIGGAILLTAGLSFIGAGVRAPTPEWGSMILIGSDSIITGQWWSSAFPGLAIAINVLGFALFGDFLRHYLNPERR